MTDPVTLAGLTVAGVVAGVVGSAGGITSLVAYPALLLAGLSALDATVANSLALVACWPGSALASRAELAGTGRWLLRWTPVAALAGGFGAALLLTTPSGTFERIVPFLVAAGAVTLLLQPRLTRLVGPRLKGRPSAFAAGFVPVGIYNGYFGAGAGIMTLAVVLLTVDGRLPHANAAKNMLVGAGTVLAAACLAVFGHVVWSAAAAVGIGMFFGATLGPAVTRRAPPGLLRWLIGLLGLALSVDLLLT